MVSLWGLMQQKKQRQHQNINRQAKKGIKAKAIIKSQLKDKS